MMFINQITYNTGPWKNSCPALCTPIEWLQRAVCVCRLLWRGTHWFSSFSQRQNHLGSLWEHCLLGPEGLKLDPWDRSSNTFTGDPDPAAPRTTPSKPLVSNTLQDTLFLVSLLLFQFFMSSICSVINIYILSKWSNQCPILCDTIRKLYFKFQREL